MEDACGVSPSLPAGGSCLPKQTYFVSEWKSAFFFFSPSPPFSSLPIRLKSLGKLSRATRNKPQLWSWAQAPAQSPAVATGPLLGAHRDRSMHPDPGFSQELGSPKSALEEEFSGF